MKATKIINNLSTLVLVVVGLVFYNFMSAQTWTAPAATAPGGNSQAPINVGGAYQIKSGELGALRIRAGQYCNAAGDSCITPGNWSCPAGQSLRQINTDGSVICESVSGNGPAPSCTQTLTTVSGTQCFVAPTCPAGTVNVNTRQKQMPWCPGDAGDWSYDVDCLRLTCS